MFVLLQSRLTIISVRNCERVFLQTTETRHRHLNSLSMALIETLIICVHNGHCIMMMTFETQWTLWVYFIDSNGRVGDGDIHETHTPPHTPHNQISDELNFRTACTEISSFHWDASLASRNTEREKNIASHLSAWIHQSMWKLCIQNRQSGEAKNFSN